MLVRAHSVVLQCKEFMRSFEDGMWIAKALKRDKHRETFNELHESLTYIFQVSFLLMKGLHVLSCLFLAFSP